MTESDKVKDAESLLSGQTNKKDDRRIDRYTSIYMNYTREILNRQSTMKYIVPVTLVFAMIGMVTITRDLSSYSRSQRETIESYASLAGGDMPLETYDPNNNLFDGHISMDQTHSISKLSKLIGVEPYGGPKTIEKIMENVANVDSPFSTEDIPFYWEVGGAGGIESDLCKCLNINVASTFGKQDLVDSESLEAYPVDGKSCKLYNVNLGTHEGTARAKKNGLISDVIPDFISSPFLPEVVSLFTPEHKARIILGVPNTNVRLNNSYGYLKQNGLFEGSFLNFVSSNHVLANNYLTHILSGKWSGVQELTEQDLITAASILKQKFVVARWADNRKISQYLVQNKQWDQSAIACMYPPENPYSQEVSEAAAAAPPPPPPEKSPEQIAAEAAIEVHNYWDNKLFEILAEQSATLLESIL